MSVPAAAPSTAEADAPAVDTVARERTGKRRVALIGLALVVVCGGIFGVRALLSADVSTDDAMVDADVVPVAAMVGGQVAHVLVPDNAAVRQGDVIAELDTVELEARVRQAEGELAAAEAQAAAADAQLTVAAAAARGGLSTAQAQVGTTRAQLGSADASVEAAEAQLARAKADAGKAAADLQRALPLVEAGAMSRERADALRAAADATAAAVVAAEAQLVGARDARTAAHSRLAEAGGVLAGNQPLDAKIAAARASADLAHARVTTATAALDLAKVALSRARVVAPADGTISSLSVRVGQVLVAGQSIGQLVPPATYVVANFKETQVGDMAVGQPVDVEVDTYGGRTFHGVVESLAAGTGSRFALLAPDNASGNFVKVVQRVPVRIRWDDPLDGVVLRPGQSAVVTVHTGG